MIPNPTRIMTDQDTSHVATPAQGDRIQAQVLRWKLTRWTLTIAILMLGVAWWIDGGEKPDLLYLENFSWIAGIALMAMGLWLLIFGKIHLFWLVAIDLKQERPAFRVGFPLFNVRVSESWTKGCHRIRRTNLYLVVPAVVRLAALGYLCYVFFGILDARYMKIGSFIGTCAFGLATWVTHRKWFPSAPDPDAIAEPEPDAPVGLADGEVDIDISDAAH